MFGTRKLLFSSLQFIPGFYYGYKNKLIFEGKSKFLCFIIKKWHYNFCSGSNCYRVFWKCRLWVYWTVCFCFFINLWYYIVQVGEFCRKNAIKERQRQTTISYLYVACAFHVTTCFRVKTRVAQGESTGTKWMSTIFVYLPVER